MKCLKLLDLLNENYFIDIANIFMENFVSLFCDAEPYWQTVQGTKCWFNFTLVLQPLHKNLAIVDVTLKLVMANKEERPDKNCDGIKSKQKLWLWKRSKLIISNYGWK